MLVCDHLAHQPRMSPGDDMALSLLASWTPVPKLSPGKSFSFLGEDILSVLTIETVKVAGKWLRVGAVGMAS